MVANARATWVTRTEDALRLAVNVSAAEKEQEDLENAAGSLPELVEAFAAMAKAASVVRALGWEGRSLAPDIRNALRQAAESLDNRKIATALRGLERFRGDAKTDLMSFWHQYAAGRLGNVAELQVLASTLGDIDGLADLSERLESVLGDLARTQDLLPSERSAQLLNEVESALRDLEGSLQPESVRRFLSAVARGGASIGLLTNDVIDWLREHNAVRGFRIVPGSAPEPTND
ncbi:MAG: hypothetical protein ACKOI2_04710 [Actinomycetota bacterium]